MRYINNVVVSMIEFICMIGLLGWKVCDVDCWCLFLYMYVYVVIFVKINIVFYNCFKI